MKILQISPSIDSKRGGQERHVIALSKKLVSYGHSVTIACCQSNHSNFLQNIDVFEFPARSLLGLKLISPKVLVPFLNKNRFDVCHLHYQTLFGESVLLSSKMCKLPVVTTLHSEMIEIIACECILRLGLFATFETLCRRQLFVSARKLGRIL